MPEAGGLLHVCAHFALLRVFLSLFCRTHSPYLAKCTFYSIGAYVGPTYYDWSLERTGDWSVGLTHMGIATVIFGLMLIFGFN